MADKQASEAADLDSLVTPGVSSAVLEMPEPPVITRARETRQYRLTMNGDSYLFAIPMSNLTAQNAPSCTIVCLVDLGDLPFCVLTGRLSRSCAALQ